MQCPTCDAALVCASCRNAVEDTLPDALSSEEPLLDEDGNLAFEAEDEDDEDAVSVAIGHDADTGMVIINFAKTTNWLALSPENAEDMANLILDNAKAGRLCVVD